MWGSSEIALLKIKFLSSLVTTNSCNCFRTADFIIMLEENSIQADTKMNPVAEGAGINLTRNSADTSNDRRRRIKL